MFWKLRGKFSTKHFRFVTSVARHLSGALTPCTKHINCKTNVIIITASMFMSSWQSCPSSIFGAAWVSYKNSRAWQIFLFHLCPIHYPDLSKRILGKWMPSDLSLKENPITKPHLFTRKHHQTGEVGSQSYWNFPSILYVYFHGSIL